VFDQGDQRGFSATLRGDGPLAQSSVAEGETLRSSAAAGECVLAPRGDHGTLAAYLDAIGAHDGICAPLALGDGMIGAFVVADRRTDVKTFDDEDARVFQTLANHATMALEKGRLIEKLRAEAARREYQAMHDPLTGLPNRAQVLLTAEQMIDAAGDRGDAVAVLLMDLDEFKDINDTLGHHMGDLLLQEIGDRLRRCSRRDDVAARLGGDEFALVVECADADAAVLVARRVLKAVQEPVDLSQLHLDVRASIGIAVWPHDGGDVASLLQRADVAMYAAKAAKTGVECYRAEVDHNTPRRLTLAAELRRALADGQLAVHYQPKADLLSGRITGAEALVRWFHPELGFIPPDEFIPVAEQTGLIGPLTTFVLGQALAQCRDWQNAGLDVGVAVNIAARSVADPGFAPLVESMLERARVSGTRLTLEITESSIMSDTHQSIDTLRELAALGVRLSVDDFGTGYSSLSYLQRLPVHELKVDRSFVFNVGVDESDRAIVRSIIQLGHSLGLAVVAEGVENQLAWDRLLEMDCDIAQGYFLSRPLAAPDLTEWLLRTAARSVMPERPLHERPELAVVRAVGE
jgi:diguanylate cyclase (GGDEF)-like protein